MDQRDNNTQTNKKKKIGDYLKDIRTYWTKPMKGRYMTFKEVLAYSVGGIGAYFIITIALSVILSTSNVIITSTLGVDATDCYVLWVIAVLANIPTTAIRGNIIDNTRSKAGKYRPYLVSMAIPTAVLSCLFVWFPYDTLGAKLGDGMIFGETKAYVFKCAMILLFNLLLNFFYYFFYDAYENLIHVLSPNTQERADATAIKSVVYSLAPSIVNLITPIVASNIFHSNTTDIRVYRLLYPIFSIVGILLCILVYANTEEKIVQARTHIIEIRFIDALKAVGKNKYFWIISFASWIGFLESAYVNIFNWLYNYGGVCSGTTYGIVITLYGNASLWGMILAPFLIRKYGKKRVLVVTNLFNILFILMLLPSTLKLSSATIWVVLFWLYLNSFMGSFAVILNPAIQADIRDYQQYITGERIDGMFAAVSTIGSVITLLTSSILPIIYEKQGITKQNAALVTSNPNILNRMLGDGNTVGQILQKQMEAGQNNYTNAFSALYDTNLLLQVLHVLIIVSAIGAALNVIPYLWYDFTEKKQKSIVKVLKVRAMFEDYDNKALKDDDLIETIEIINNSRKLSAEKKTDISKSNYKGYRGKDRKQKKKQYREDIEHNNDIDIAQFVCDELDKFSTPVYKEELEYSKKIFDIGLNALLNDDSDTVKADLKKVKAMSKTTEDEKKIRKFYIEQYQTRLSSIKYIKEYFKDRSKFVEPDVAVIENLYNELDVCDEKIKEIVTAKTKDKNELKKIQVKKKELNNQLKKEMDGNVQFARAARPYLNAKKLIVEAENYTKLDEIENKYKEIIEKRKAEENLIATGAEA